MSEKTSVIPAEITVASSTEGMEEWRPIAISQGKYEVSNFGRVRNVKTNRILKPGLCKLRTAFGGYYIVRLSCSDKLITRTIHRLVASAFLPEIPGKTQIDHIDGNSLNNSVTNLRRVTPKENCNNPITLERRRCMRQKGVFYSDKALENLRRNMRKVQRTIDSLPEQERIEFYKKRGRSIARKVVCLETGVIYESVSEAAKHYNLTPGAVTQSCNRYKNGCTNREKYSGSSGVHFSYQENCSSSI